MSLFAIADLHLSLGCDKPMDVFPGWQNYTDRLEKNWRAVVGRDDTVVIAGDISWAMKLEEAINDFSFINSLPGKKLILKGNHDYWWSTRKKIEDFLKQNGLDTIRIIHNNAVIVGEVAVCGTRGWLYNAETDEDVKIVNREVGRLNASIDDAEKQGAKPVVFLHYPPVYDGAECKGILDVLKERGIQKCYFGHIHGSEAARRAITGEYEGIKMVLISCDYLNFMPALV
ncbi:metallophosphoesterase [Caproiciproducens galactitolivorans]|uniref:Metallophosphoesterase n=1 Tax=Caproiciproducens galactitolivorans TaxID=642589 RepID=A0ABT4BTV6_9FIRM|nr:metallophosphoesterase [Caproiciproducens galactitolivorans]MCY1714334.1 metallophosphoesterase [Caproiciproducens galactitolivorans]